MQILGIGTVAVTLLASAIAAIIAHRVTLPIQIAATAVIKLGKGDLDTRIPIKGKDEFGTLGCNINHMAQQLQYLLQIVTQVKLTATQVNHAIAGNCGAIDQLATEALKQIEGIVANIQFETTEVIKAMELGTAQVIQGTHSVGHSKQSLSQILNVCN